MNCASENISISPIAKVREDTIAGLLTEKTLTDIFKALSHRNSYIISVSKLSDYLKVLFVIDGYRVESYLPIEELTDGDWYASIVKANNEVLGQDVDGVYTGVTFTRGAPVEGAISQRLFNWSGSEATIYDEDENRINPSSILIGGIDGKH